VQRVGSVDRKRPGGSAEKRLVEMVPSLAIAVRLLRLTTVALCLMLVSTSTTTHHQAQLTAAINDLESISKGRNTNYDFGLARQGKPRSELFAAEIHGELGTVNADVIPSTKSVRCGAA